VRQKREKTRQARKGKNTQKNGCYLSDRTPERGGERAQKNHMALQERDRTEAEKKGNHDRGETGGGGRERRASKTVRSRER